jgi:hypothetical protein
MGFSRSTVVVCLVSSVLAAAACTATASSSGGDPETSSGGTTPTGGKDGGGGADGSTSGGSACERVCAKAKSASCSEQSTCVADCEADLANVPASCKAESDAAMECAATKATGFTCNSKGKAVASGCDAESTALVQCILGGGKDAGTDSGPGSCGNLTSGNAACDTCVNQRCCAQAAACSNDAECGAILSCFSTCNDNACFTTCENKHPTGVAKEQAFYACLGSSCKTQCQ